MKKLLSVLLTLSMLLTLLIVPISADGTEPENSDEFTPVDLGTAETPRNTTTEGGVEYYTDANSVKYIVIRDADDFKAMTGTSNYIFANNIDLSTDSVALKVANSEGALISGWYGILDGNGKALTGFEISGNDNGLFRLQDATKDVVIKNITFGALNNKITGTASGNGSNAIISGKTKVKTITIENCVAYVNFEAKTNVGSVSAFIGQPACAATYVFNKCAVYGSIQGKNKIGGFVANVASGATMSFENCHNYANIVGYAQGLGGFVAHSATASVVLSFDGCTNNGNISINNDKAKKSTPNIGAFVGQLNSGFASCGFTNCKNNGILDKTSTTATAVNSGEFVGNTDTPAKISFTFENENQSLNGLIGTYPYITKTTRGAIHYSKTINGLQTLAAAKAAYFQTAAGSAEGLQNVRVLLALPESEIANIKNIEFKVVFKNLNVNEGATTKTLTVTDADAAIASYYSVIADTKIAEAPEGYVMVAVVVTDVDTSVWTASGANLEVYMTSAGGTNTIYNNTPETENKNP